MHSFIFITRRHQDSFQMSTCAMHRWSLIPPSTLSSKPLGRPSSLRSCVRLALKDLYNERLTWYPGINPYQMSDPHLPNVGSFFYTLHGSPIARPMKEYTLGIRIFILSTTSQLTKSSNLNRCIGYYVSTHKQYTPVLQILCMLSLIPPRSLTHFLHSLSVK